MNKTRSKSAGFSLIELLTVLFIIATLTGIIVNSISGSRAKARDAQRVSDLGQIQLSLSLYLDRCGRYPSSLVTSANNGCPTANPAITLGSFISQIPTPPAGASQVAYDYDLLNNPSGIPISYVMHAKLEGTNPAVARGLNAANIPAASGGYSWVSDPTVAPWSACSSAATSVDYCIAPN